MSFNQSQNLPDLSRVEPPTIHHLNRMYLDFSSFVSAENMHMGGMVVSGENYYLVLALAQHYW